MRHTSACVEVVVPTHTKLSYNQFMRGKYSSLSPEIEEFRGIPFATVTARWEHALLRESLPKDVFEAVHNGPKCPQLYKPDSSRTFVAHVDFPTDVTESELDCLNLFIIRPSDAALSRIDRDSNAKLPVMVWIHGGGYGWGAGTDPMWDPTRFVLRSIETKSPLIAVSINYRLGLFGFAASSALIRMQSNLGLRGCNFGLRDQKVGITWVSRNIAAFGGDPMNITIAGHSAGAISVHALTLEAQLSPGKPLFRRAIIQSGAIGTLGPVSVEKAESQMTALCHILGLEEENECTALTKLRNIKADDLIQVCKEQGWLSFPLVNDNLTLSSDSDSGVVTIDLEQSIAAEPVLEPSPDMVEVLIGEADVEGSGYNIENKIQSYNDAKALFSQSNTSGIAVTSLLKAWGILDSASLCTIREGVTRFLTDIQFSYPIARARDYFLTSEPVEGHPEFDATNEQNGSAVIYRRTPVKYYKVMFGNPFPGPKYGLAHHCVELIYLFDAFHKDILLADQEDLSSLEGNTYAPCLSLGNCGENPKGELVGIVQPPKPSSFRKVIQDHWIGFIVNRLSKAVTPDTGAVPTLATVYGLDRVVRKEDFSSGEQWIKQAERFGVLCEYKIDAQIVFEAIQALASRD